MGTGVQDWTMSDAAREILVLTKNDEDLTSLTPVRSEADHTGAEVSSRQHRSALVPTSLRPVRSEADHVRDTSA